MSTISLSYILKVNRIFICLTFVSQLTLFKVCYRRGSYIEYEKNCLSKLSFSDYNF